jgi:protein involved in polysaccharide export with SLBB domain
MRWASLIGFAALAALVAAAPARADGQPKYATMQKSWSPEQEQPVQPQQQQQAPVRLAAVQQPQQPTVISNGTDDYRLGTGDKVRITVFGEDDLSGEFQVDSTGYLRLPMIGQVKAAGDTAHALEDQLTATYSKGYLLEPRVNVEVTTYRPFYIIGEVNKPGEYAYVNGMNVLNAVALAGGYTQKAIEGHVYLRKANTNQELRVAADQTITVMPGDIVRVSSNPIWDVISIVSPLTPLIRY